MTDDEFDQYLADAMEEFEHKREALETEFGVGHHGRFVVEYERSTLLFFEKEKPVVEAKIIPVATHIPEKKSLVWSWSNRNLPDYVREQGEVVKKLYEVTGYPLFNEASVECDEDMAWEIAALACKCLDAKGVYRVPHSNLNSYVLITQIKHYG